MKGCSKKTIVIAVSSVVVVAIVVIAIIVGLYIFAESTKDTIKVILFFELRAA